MLSWLRLGDVNPSTVTLEVKVTTGEDCVVVGAAVAGLCVGCVVGRMEVGRAVGSALGGLSPQVSSDQPIPYSTAVEAPPLNTFW